MDAIKKMKICYVILHYKTIEETTNCIDDIMALNGEKQIIVVDNGSNDGSGEIIKKKYCGSGIKVIISSQNQGFARGNNIGIKAVDDKNDTLVVVCNSDLRFNQREFGQILKNDYKDEPFAVWAPDVMSEDGTVHENPTINEIYVEGQLHKEIKRFAKVNNLNKKGFYNLARVVNRAIFRRNRKLDWRKDLSSDHRPIKVHGSCFALTPVFFKQYDGLFDGTFLFQEENILSDMCLRKGLRIKYDPKAKVVHLGSRSYKKRISNKNDRFSHYIEECLRSLNSYADWRKTI